MELQAEIHRRVGEGDERVVRDAQMLVHLVEAELDVEPLVVGDQPPELMLEDDRHLLRILLMQPVGDLHVGVVGAEGYVEMVVARQSTLGGTLERLAHDGAHRLFHHVVIAEQILAHRLVHIPRSPV